MIKFDDYYKMIALNSMILINLVQGFDDNPRLGLNKNSISGSTIIIVYYYI